MGALSRTKGKVFERSIARELRTHWPDAIVRRASQAERADNPDVFVEGGPPILARLWLELHDARDPNANKKLDQAERDVLAHRARRGNASERIPVVIWHRLGERTVWVTTRMRTLFELVAPASAPAAPALDDARMTFTFDTLVAILKQVPA